MIQKKRLYLGFEHQLKSFADDAELEDIGTFLQLLAEYDVCFCQVIVWDLSLTVFLILVGAVHPFCFEGFLYICAVSISNMVIYVV